MQGEWGGSLGMHAVAEKIQTRHCLYCVTVVIFCNPWLNTASEALKQLVVGLACGLIVKVCDSVTLELRV